MTLWSWLKAKTNSARVTTPAAEGAGREEEATVELTYSTDQPIQSAVNDRFARAPFAARIAETIASRKDRSSLVLGLYGQWGDGKTSVLHMIEEHLRQEARIVVIRFNPWHFTSEEQLIRGFFGTLAGALDTSLSTTGEKLGEALKKYGSLLSIASSSAGQAAKGLGEALSATTLDGLKARIELALSESGKTIVVLIDDIDRLDRTETHAIFKLVKLSAGFSHTTYLLAFDEEVVAAALGERYGEGGYAAGRAFLEKIIQVPLHLPPADIEALRRVAFEGVDKALSHAEITLQQGDIDLFTIQFMSGLEPRLETPRQARLYSNALLFSLPLVKGEVNIVDFMLIEGLRIFYPKLHAAVRDNPSKWLDEEQGRDQEKQGWIRESIASAIPAMAGDEQRSTMRLIERLFPRSTNVVYSGEWEKEWARDKRVCSGSYFKRYFAYGIPPNDISDVSVDMLIESSPGSDPEALEASLESLMRDTPGALVKKMRQRESFVTCAQATALLPSLARNGFQVPTERGPFVMGGARTQLAILIAHLLKAIPVGEARDRMAERIIEVAEPLTFAADCIRWMQPSRDDQEAQYLLATATIDRLRELIVARAAEKDRDSPLYRQFGYEARVLYWLWRKVDAASVSARLRVNLEGQGEEVDAFLDAHVGEAWGLTDGLPRRADFRREAYDDIARLINPEEIARDLRRRYGAELEHPEYHQNDDVPFARRLAHQFVVVHAAATGEDQSQDEKGGEIEER